MGRHARSASIGGAVALMLVAGTLTAAVDGSTAEEDAFVEAVAEGADITVEQARSRIAQEGAADPLVEFVNVTHRASSLVLLNTQLAVTSI